DLACLLPRLVPRPAPGGAAALHVETLNVERDNRRQDLVLAHLAATPAEVVALQEVDGAWARTLDDLPGFPHRVLRPEEGHFGLGVLSRHPLREVARVAHDGPAWTLVVEVAAPGGPVHLATTHAMPPLGPADARLRDDHLGDLADLV